MCFLYIFVVCLFIDKSTMWNSNSRFETCNLLCSNSYTCYLLSRKRCFCHHENIVICFSFVDLKFFDFVHEKQIRNQHFVQMNFVVNLNFIFISTRKRIHFQTRANNMKFKWYVIKSLMIINNLITDYNRHYSIKQKKQKIYY